MKTFRLISLCLLLPLAAAGLWAQSGNRTAPKPVHTPAPSYPAALIDSGRDGSAVIEFTVGEDGRPAQATVKSADHPAFGEAAMAALPEWRFEPGTIDGRPAARKVALPFQFTAPPDQKVNATFGRKVFREPTQAPIAAADFRGSVAPISSGRVPYPRSAAGSGQVVNVEVEFVIAPDGRPINPVVVNEVPAEFAALALLHVAGLVFEHPLHEGRPVYVQTKRTIRFAE
jgi:TonB family protein